jgi:Sulfotransferase domain
MWSGPRNISTALMRSWGNRPDTMVCDEPLYAHYLRHVPVEHPGRDEVIASHDGDWESVVRWLTEDEPAGVAIFYQKHMAHHLLPHIGRGWLTRLNNCFLIRDPGQMLASLNAKMGLPLLRDTGLEQQVEIFQLVRKTTGQVPPVIDSADVLRDPRRVLSRLCEAVGIRFSDAMLNWPPGRRETDGVWARYWYDAVERSTGFEQPREKQVELSPDLERLAAECRPFYEELAQHRIT